MVRRPNGSGWSNWTCRAEWASRSHRPSWPGWSNRCGRPRRPDRSNRCYGTSRPGRPDWSNRCDRRCGTNWNCKCYLFRLDRYCYMVSRYLT